MRIVSNKFLEEPEETPMDSSNESEPFKKLKMSSFLVYKTTDATKQHKTAKSKGSKLMIESVFFLLKKKKEVRLFIRSEKKKVYAKQTFDKSILLLLDLSSFVIS